MIVTATGISIGVIGLGLAGWALWKVSEAQIDGPAEQVGPYVLPFVAGMAIAIVGAFVLLGQLSWRLLL